MGRRSDSLGMALSRFLGPLAVVTLMAFLCVAAYRWDNKYTAPGPQARSGVLELSESALNEAPAFWLVEGWAYYADALLAPEDFVSFPPPPTGYLYIGQIGGFDAGIKDAPPHGSASYRMVIEAPAEERSYALALPEIFSAYRLYVNGKLLSTMGDPDPAGYRAQTGERSVEFQADGRIEFLLAVSDYSRFYSGMVYPPVFGEPEAVARMLSARMIFRAALVFIALTIGALSLLVGLLAKRNIPAVWYALLCLLAVGFTCYPITLSLLGGSALLYALENVSFCGMIAVVMILQRQFGAPMGRRWWSWGFIGFGAFACAASALLPAVVAGGHLPLMLAYSTLISIYQWIAAAYLTATAVYNLTKNAVHSAALLRGILAFDCALVMDRLLPLFEPAVTGWFPEIGSFALILFIGAAIGQEIAQQYRDKAVLTERAGNAERLFQAQLSHYATMRREMEDIKAMRHDMRHHLAVIDELNHSREYEKLDAYIAQHRQALSEGDMESVSSNAVVNVLAHHYAGICRENRIDFVILCDMENETHVSDVDICRVLSNLLENAVEACLRFDVGRRWIRVAIAQTELSVLAFRVENSTSGDVRQEDGAFLSSKGDRKGYGMESIALIADKYEGVAEYKWDRAKREFAAVVSL